jgi:hypothetical protein
MNPQDLTPVMPGIMRLIVNPRGLFAKIDDGTALAVLQRELSAHAAEHPEHAEACREFSGAIDVILAQSRTIGAQNLGQIAVKVLEELAGAELGLTRPLTKIAVP